MSRTLVLQDGCFSWLAEGYLRATMALPGIRLGTHNRIPGTASAEKESDRVSSFESLSRVSEQKLSHHFAFVISHQRTKLSVFIKKIKCILFV